MKFPRLAATAGLGLAGAAAYLAVAPTRAVPVAWAPPRPPSRKEGPFRDNERLAPVRRIGEGLPGPETVVPDGDTLLAGLADGRVVRIHPASGAAETIGETGGRPLGLATLPDGAILVADAQRGLLRLHPGGRVETLVNHAGGAALGFCNSVAVDRAGTTAWFTDSSTLWGFGQDNQDILEHAGRGRLLRHDLASGETVVLKDGLDFANGVALGPEDRFLLVNETGAYRTWRLWLDGDKAGNFEVFADNHPGFPDNLSFDGERFWIGFPVMRSRLVDGLAPYPAIRKVAIRAMRFGRMPVEKRAAACAFDLDGKPVAWLQGGPGSYGFVTHAAAQGGTLYLGSLFEPGVGVLDDWRAGRD